MKLAARRAGWGILDFLKAMGGTKSQGGVSALADLEYECSIKWSYREIALSTLHKLC